MMETMTKRNNGATLQAQSNFSSIREHLQSMSDWLVDLLGDDYAILLDKLRRSDNKIFYSTRCIHYNHNNKHYDENPSGWIEVLLPNGWLKSGCYACGKAQIVYHDGKYQPTPTLLTLSRSHLRLKLNGRKRFALSATIKITLCLTPMATLCQ
jgi:hypothetical protein